MVKIYKPVIAAAALLIALGSHASSDPPGVITEFCAKKFGGDIAGVNQPFNATDVVEKECPPVEYWGISLQVLHPFCGTSMVAVDIINI
jgi:hypothetical protein